MKAKTQVKIGIITAGASAVPCIHRLMSSFLSPSIEMVVIFASVYDLTIYALYVSSLITRRLLMAKCFYVIWCVSALRMVLFLTVLLQGHQYTKAFLIGGEVVTKAILLWIGIIGLKRLNNTSKQID